MIRGFALIGTVLVALATAACSFQPVYGGNGMAGPSVGAVVPRLAFATPTTRPEQVVQQELRKLLPQSGAGTVDAELVVAVGGGYYPLSRSALRSPAVSVTATLSFEHGGRVVTITRTATGAYESFDQQIANQAGYDAAVEAACRSLAEALRLALFAEFA